ncbi:addiction module protein [Duganella rivi]|nr:addiction module protein [Duganella rivi]
MMKVDLLAQAKALPVDDQIALAEAIWDAIVDSESVPPPTQTQQEELKRRHQRHLANPNNVMSLEEVTAAVENSLRK